MNWLERQVYEVVKGNPKLKNKIRNLYQRAFDILPQAKPKEAYNIIVREGYFFGFHDHTPFSDDNSRLLANRFDIPLRMPTPEDELEIGYFSGTDYLDFKSVTRTRAWMWHMGCKLQWRGSSNQVVFNDHVDGHNVGRVVDSDTGESFILQDTIGSVSPDGRFAAGYSFSRVEECMPGYGYIFDIGDPEKGIERPRLNGIHLIDLESGKRNLLYSIYDLTEIDPEPSMKGAHHFVTHAVFSPDSERFVFLHRWVRMGNLSKRWSRLVTCDLNGMGLSIFPTDEMVSHIGWRDAKTIIAYCRVPRYGDQYVLFKVDEPLAFEIIGQSHFNSDGHPSFEQSGRWMVTDTYPDRRRRQNLVLYDTHEDRRYDIAQLSMPARYQSRPFHHWSCDLHPRWDRAGNWVCFDSTYTGTRSLCTINLESDLQKGCVKSIA